MQKAPTASRLFYPYYALVAAAGFGLLLWTTPGLDFSLWPFLVLWLALTIITDASPISLPNGGYITVASTLDYAGILIFGPVATAWVELLNTLILHGMIQKKPIKRTLFNAAAFSLTILVAGGVYLRLGGPVGRPPSMPGHLLPLLAMGVTYFIVNTLTVSMVIALNERKRIWRIWQVNFRWTFSHMFAAVLVGLAVAVMHESLGLWGVFLFVTPLLLASYAFRLFTETKRDIIDFVGVLAGVIDEVDPYTHRHSERVARYAVQIARGLQLPEREIETVEFAALLHDLGKIKMEHRELLLKPAGLTQEERRAMSQHAEFGAAMAAKIRSLKATSEIVMAHHERMDGKGYPAGIPAGQVPIGSRIVNVADAFDAMTTDRVYRKAMPVSRAVEELQKNAGTQFDAEVVRVVVQLVEKGELQTEPREAEAAVSSAAPPKPVAPDAVSVPQAG